MISQRLSGKPDNILYGFPDKKLKHIGNMVEPFIFKSIVRFQKNRFNIFSNKHPELI